MHSTLTYSLYFVVIGCKIITFWRNKQIFCKKNCVKAYIFLYLLPLTSDFLTFKVVDENLSKSLNHLARNQESLV